MVIHPKFMTCCWVGEVWDHFPIIMFYWPFFLWFLTQMWLGFPLYRTSDVLTASFYPVYWVLLGLPGGGARLPDTTRSSPSTTKSSFDSIVAVTLFDHRSSHPLFVIEFTAFFTWTASGYRSSRFVVSLFSSSFSRVDSVSFANEQHLSPSWHPKCCIRKTRESEF